MPISIIPRRPAFVATIARVCKDTGFELEVGLSEAIVRLRQHYEVADQQLIAWLYQGHTLESDFAYYRMDGAPWPKSTSPAAPQPSPDGGTA